MSDEKRNDLGAALLAELARDPDSTLVREFHALFYEYIWKRLWRDQGRLSERVSRHLNAYGPTAPRLRPEEIDEVAHDATARALHRICQNAAEFDPARGTATHWVIGASEFAFVEVAKEVVHARRPKGIEFADPEVLAEIADPRPGTEELVVARLSSEQLVAEAAEILSEREWQALRLVVTERYTYAEAATIIFCDPTFTRQVDGLLSRAKRKLREAWPHLRPGSGLAEASNVRDEPDDMEGTNE